MFIAPLILEPTSSDSPLSADPLRPSWHTAELLFVGRLVGGLQIGLLLVPRLGESGVVVGLLQGAPIGAADEGTKEFLLGPLIRNSDRTCRTK